MCIRFSAIVAALFLLTSCSAVTITNSGAGDFTYRPHYEDRKSFFLWGFIGDHHVDVSAICGDRPVAQMQSKFTGQDVLYSALTLGLYLPRTAKVWCELEEGL